MTKKSWHDLIFTMAGFALCLTIGAVIVQPNSVLAQGLSPQEPQKNPHSKIPHHHFKDRLAPLKKRPSKAERAKLLENLYEQLEAAPDAENAAIIASAIEKLWLQSDSDTVNVLMDRANKSLGEKDLDRALQILSFVTQIAPGYSEGWNRRAMIHYMKRDYTLTMFDLRQALARDPRHFKAINGLAIVLRDLGKKKAALKALKRALKIHPFLDAAKQSEEELTVEIEGQGI